MTVPCGDLEIDKEAPRTGRRGILFDCCAGQLATLTHRIALQLPRQDVSGECEWASPLRHLSKSEVLRWPLPHFVVEGSGVCLLRCLAACQPGGLQPGGLALQTRLGGLLGDRSALEVVVMRGAPAGEQGPPHLRSQPCDWSRRPRLRA